jgi:hypothetical protein
MKRSGSVQCPVSTETEHLVTDFSSLITDHNLVLGRVMIRFLLRFLREKEITRVFAKDSRAKALCESSTEKDKMGQKVGKGRISDSDSAIRIREIRIFQQFLRVKKRIRFFYLGIQIFFGIRSECGKEGFSHENLLHCVFFRKESF